MGLFGSILFGGIGWALGGPIGGLVGAFIGGSLGANQQAGFNGNVHRGRARRSSGGDFSASLMVLTAAVLKADGKVLKSEIDFVKRFLKDNLKNNEAVKEHMLLLRDLLKKDIPVRDVSEQIRQYMPHPDRLELLRYLFAISSADGHVDKSEVEVIQNISNWMGISAADFESIKAIVNYKDSSDAYKILEVSPDASDEEIKKSYRKMAIKYHPDKLSQMDESYQNIGKEKFQKVQEAYEVIKKERGIV